MKKVRASDRTFNIALLIFMTFVIFIMLYPFLYLLAASFSSSSVMRLSLIPARPSVAAYEKVVQNQYLWNGFLMTLLRLGIGTPLTLVVTIATAYALSKPYFPNRTLWTGVLVLTMFFSGGLIPSYLLVRSVGIYNTVWALVLPGLISTYNMIIMRNFFMSLPTEIEESAKIDGANDIIILIRIVVPVSGAIIATVTLWTMVGHWNAWFDSLIYFNDMSKHVLQLVLRRLVIEGKVLTLFPGEDMGIGNPEAVKAATVLIGTAPIIMAYPFLQKYFVKGIMIGSLKG